MKLQYCVNRTGAIPPEKLALTGLEVQTAARAFHRTIPGYEPTPLASLDHLARRLGVSQVLVKDESKRFGLNAFKALGGSYAMARHLGEQLGLSQEQLTFEALGTPEVREKLGERTFVTATDGNHGRGVAWAARQLGHRAVVYMPKGSARERLENIRAQGAQAEITDLNYDDAVRLADRMGREHGWTLIQDTPGRGMRTFPHGSSRATPPSPRRSRTNWKSEAGRSPPTCFSRRGWAALRGPCWAALPPGGAGTVPSPASWSRTGRTASTAAPRRGPSPR